MPMKLIKKKAPRCGLMRWLSEEEETAVKMFFGKRNGFNSEQQFLAAKVIVEIRESDVWCTATA